VDPGKVQKNITKFTAEKKEKWFKIRSANFFLMRLGKNKIVMKISEKTKENWKDERTIYSFIKYR
jgi:hypothetical protein